MQRERAPNVGRQTTAGERGEANAGGADAMEDLNGQGKTEETKQIGNIGQRHFW